MLIRENQLSTLFPYFSWTVNALPSPDTTPASSSSNGPSTAPQTTASSTAAPTTTPNSGDGTWNGRPLRLVFEDNFSGSGVDTGKWEHEVSLWGGGVSMITCRSLLFDIAYSSYVQTKLFIGFQG